MASKQVYEYGSIPLVVTDQGDSYQLNAADVAAMEVAGVTETFLKERMDIMRERARAFGYAISVVAPDGSEAVPVSLPEWGS